MNAMVSKRVAPLAASAGQKHITQQIKTILVNKRKSSIRYSRRLYLQNEIDTNARYVLGGKKSHRGGREYKKNNNNNSVNCDRRLFWEIIISRI